MKGVGWLFLAVFLAYGCAMAAPLARRWIRGRAGVLAGWCCVPVVLACPLLIPSASVGVRAASAFASGEIAFKMVDFLRCWGGVDRRIVLREYVRFLVPLPVLAAAYPDHKRRLARPDGAWPQLLRIAGGTAGVVAAVLALRLLSGLAPVRSSFALNHVVMLMAFVLAIESLSRAIWGLERLAGFDVAPIVRDAYLARTVAEFWRRYNYRIHDWLYRNVFLPGGGRRAPTRSVLLVFLASGVFHELMFVIATSRVTGYQLVFFAVQGPAALASGRLERLARDGGLAGRVAAHGTAIGFMAVTSVLFFDGVSMVFPFLYVSRSPLP